MTQLNGDVQLCGLHKPPRMQHCYLNVDIVTISRKKRLNFSNCDNIHRLPTFTCIEASDMTYG